jgi:hypothetical protein
MSWIEAVKPLRLANLRGHHLARLRVDSRIFSHFDYAVTRQWARAFYDHADKIDGLIFHSRHNPDLHVAALFDRAGPDCVKIVKTENLDSGGFKPMLTRIVDRYELTLL